MSFTLDDTRNARRYNIVMILQINIRSRYCRDEMGAYWI